MKANQTLVIVLALLVSSVGFNLFLLNSRVNYERTKFVLSGSNKNNYQKIMVEEYANFDANNIDSHLTTDNEKTEQDRANEEAAAAAAVYESEVQAAEAYSNINYENYDAIKTGMTWKQVVAILGDEAKETVHSEYQGYVNAVYTWSAPNGIPAIIVNFSNGRVGGKSQVGL